MRILRDNDESRNNLNKHFRELRNLETEPSADLWDRTEYRLNEEREHVKHDHWYKALILLLIPFTIINIILTYDLEDYYTRVTSGDQEKGFVQLSQLPAKLIPNNLNESGSWGNFLNGEFLSFAKTIEKNDVGKNESDGVGGSTAIEIMEIDQTPTTNSKHNGETVHPRMPSSLERKMLETSATTDDVMKYHSRKMVNEGINSVKGFHVGIEGGFNNNWMIYRDNTDNPQVGNKKYKKFDIGATYGISIGYDFSNRFGIEAEWLIQSPIRQEYWELRYGKIPVSGEVSLKYMHLPVMFKYKWTKVSSSSPNPHVLNLVTGIQYSRLRDAQKVQNSLDMEKVSALINRNELGLLLGLEYDIFMHRNSFLTLGARASISADASAFPYFNSGNTATYNLLVGLNASFHYLARRNK